MRTFECRRRGNLWTWDIDRADRELTVVHGRRGKPARVLRYSYKQVEQAQKELERRIRDKLRVGYVETTPVPAQLAGLRESMERALALHPDDLATHMAFADYLLEQGDPRGELIRVQLAVEDPSRSSEERRQLQARAEELLRKHRNDWLGELGPALGVSAASATPASGVTVAMDFARGWLTTLSLSELTVELARALVRSSQVSLLRQLAILSCRWERTDGKPERDDLPRFQAYPATYVLARSPFLRNLRVLQLGPLEKVPGDPDAVRYPDASALPDLLPRLLHLEELTLNVQNLDSELLFASPFPPSLRVLRISGMRIDDDARSLVRSRLLGQLQELRLWHAGLTDVGAGHLARWLPRPQLKLLDLSFNHLTYAGIETLRSTGTPLVCTDQAEPSRAPNGDPGRRHDGYI